MSCVEGDEVSVDSTTVKSDEASADSTTVKSDEKVPFLLRAVGGAPILKKKRWEVPRSRTIGFVANFLKNHLKLLPDQQVFIYVNQSFAPAADTTIGAIKDCFHSEGTLVFHYASTPAWG